jgi:DNA-binding LacI/PurR family transcriptional regulator
LTIGVLASWQLYAGTIHTLLNPILQGIYATARARDCNILIACGVVSNFAPETRTAWPFLSPQVDFVPVGPWNTDGLIVIAPRQAGDDLSAYLEQVMAAGHPIVFVESAENRPVICAENAKGIHQVLLHLKKHGYQRLAFIGGGVGWQGDSRERLQAFLEGCEELGLETEQRLMAYGGFSTSGGYQAMRQILDTGASFTAVVASNDESAVGAIQALRASGLRVPEDVAVTGFDNRFEARNQTPPLTTINQPGRHIGREALNLMLRRLKGEADGSEIVRVPARLVVRESCGCPRDAIVTDALEELDQSEEAREPSVVKQWLIQTMTDAVFAEAGQLSWETIRIQCERMIEAFLSSLEQRKAEPFEVALADVLQPVRRLDEDAHAWQNAITALRHWWRVLMEPADVETRRAEVDAWLDQARIAISECAQAQLLRYFARQDTLTQQLSLMSADLAEALELSQMQKVINQYLPALAIKHAQVVLFEPDGENPVGWSVFPEMTEEDLSAAQRFPTHQFPPPSRYPEDQAFHLALLPLTIHNQPAGFMAFDAGNLVPCLAVLRQLTSALERIRLYHEAAEGRRMAEEADRMKSRST